MTDNRTSTKRHSQRREVIYETLKATTAHPDTDAVYAAVREKLPEIGVATVYRVLRELVAEGKAVTLETTDDRIHYAHRKSRKIGLYRQERKDGALRGLPRLREKAILTVTAGRNNAAAER